MKTKILIPLAGMVLFCACKGSSSSSESADTVGIVRKEKVVTHSADTAPVDRKLVKTADMRFKVKDVRKTGDQIAELTASCNGTVIDHFTNSTTIDSTNILKTDDSLLRITVLNTTADMTVKIPPAKVEAFVNQVADMGIQINQLKMSVDDKTFDYISTRLKLKNQAELLEREKDGTTHAKSADELLAIKDNMVDQAVKNLKTDDSTKNSVIKLSFYESNVIHRETIANPDLAAYNLPFFTRLWTSVKTGWDVFMEIIIDLAYLWVLLPVGYAVWMGLRYYNKKKTVVH